MNTEEAQIFVANTSAVFSDGDVMYRIVKGKTTARRGTKIIKGREHMWKPFTVDFDLPMKKEQAAKRGPGRPRKDDVASLVLTKEDVTKKEEAKTEE